MDSTEKHFSRFLIIWLGQLLSKIGGGISAFALGIFLFEQLGSTSSYSLLLLCAVLPSVLLAPIGGVIADRKDRKLMMLLADIGSAFCIFLIMVMLAVKPNSYWAIYIGITLCSGFMAFHSPAYKASISDLLDETSYAKASGLIQLAEASRYLIAPVIAGYLMLKISLNWVLFIDLVTFLAGAMTVFFIRNVSAKHLQTTDRVDFQTEFRQGFRYLMNNQTLRHLLWLITIVTFLTGILQVLFVPIVLSFASPSTLGTVQSIAASGMLISSVFIGLLSKTNQQYKILAWSLAATGLFYLLIGFTGSTLAFTLAAFGFFLTLPFVNTSLEVLFRKNIANEMQGRVWSLISLISQLGMLVALGSTGLLADFVFNPLLTETGTLAHSLGQLFGTGSSKGSSLMVVISGATLLIYALMLAKNRQHRTAIAVGLAN